MNCHCGLKAVFEHPTLCKEHFCSYVEDAVLEGVRREFPEALTAGSDVVVGVACSGGKDSTVLLSVLHKLDIAVIALAIDEGIPGYRDVTLTFLQEFCATRGITLQVRVAPRPLSTLTTLLGKSPCTVCGIFRRHLLNEGGPGISCIATGHNLDDELQSMLLNVALGQSEQNARLLPRKYSALKRIKPLRMVAEKAILAYAVLTGITPPYIECPHASGSLRWSIRDLMTALEEQEPGAKLRLHAFLEEERVNDGPAALSPVGHGICAQCGQPSSQESCAYCEAMREVMAHG
ncbi:TIGR00269 family protein [Candidatus Woesearchaeota archaeon CG_4_10_14_0_2_um_filter_57_5]|nr:MAG: TIGR00269 family protein [Candidatus Woesearchaeota archaeon CG1_02_57_44]PIN68070.1 MAG: TIGR00269 family protein [Candidatus Woesearchaeota archaeon CG11_big_fil_rev_8_21_14_0_20_57_5]PIZ55470.1 MAG: TIGR00269 family protein [Candidatus Woesearchaeota archaeon CG_4_10_14_0_2_um_filter_57_5]